MSDSFGTESVAPASTSTSRLERVRDNNAEAREQLCDLYGLLVYDWCRNWGLSPEDVADAVQEVFRSVVTGIHRFRREGPQDSFGQLWLIERLPHDDLRVHGDSVSLHPR
jgi:RNA polymerase sigma-70 factor, ECF subfamily